jgi:uncharacterized protein (DUF1499 family)
MMLRMSLGRLEMRMPPIRRAMPLRRSRAADWARLTGGLAVPVLALAALGMRIGLVPAAALLPALACGFLLAVAALGLAAYALVDIWDSGAAGARSAFAGLFYASPALALLGLIAGAALAYPRLADISTDVTDPPAFSGPGRAGSRPDAEDIALQAESYPELAPRLYSQSLGDVYFAVRDLVDERAWTVIRDTRPAGLQPESPVPVASQGGDDDLARILAQKSVMTQSRSEVTGAATAGPRPATDTPEAPPQGPVDMLIIEATARTPVFGFLDDVAIRLRDTAEGTRVDMRSASRLGEHDLGQNMRRIRAFLADLDSALQPEPGATGAGAEGSSGG